MIHEFGHGFEELPPDAGETLHEGVGPDKHRSLGVARRDGIGADDAGVQEPDELGLEVRSLVGAAVRRGPEPGRGLAVLGDPCGAAVNSSTGGGRVEGNSNAGAVGDCGNLGNRQGSSALEADGGELRELGDHAADFIEVGAAEGLGSLLPVARIGDVAGLRVDDWMRMDADIWFRGFTWKSHHCELGGVDEMVGVWLRGRADWVGGKGLYKQAAGDVSVSSPCGHLLALLPLLRREWFHWLLLDSLYGQGLPVGGVLTWYHASAPTLSDPHLRLLHCISLELTHIMPNLEGSRIGVCGSSLLLIMNVDRGFKLLKMMIIFWIEILHKRKV